MQDVSMNILSDYLLEHYTQNASEQGLFMKLVEEIGEVAEILNMRAGRKSHENQQELEDNLGKELVDVIHYTVAIAAINQIDLSKTIIQKDIQASIKYDHAINLADYIQSRNRSEQTEC